MRNEVEDVVVEKQLQLKKQANVILVAIKGEPREFANKMLDCFLRPRWEKMNRPHMRMCSCFSFLNFSKPPQKNLISTNKYQK